MTALFVLGVIVLFMLLDLGVQIVSGRQEPAAVLLPAFAAEVRASRGRVYSPGHTWARRREDGEVRIGSDDFARAAVGPADSFELPSTGTLVAKGDPLVTAVKGGRRLTFPRPLSGTVTDATPDRDVGGDRSWLVALDPARLGSEIRSLVIGEEAATWIGREIARFREFIVGAFHPGPAGATLPDGGTPVEGALTLLPDEAWDAFEAEFLAGR